VKRRFVVSLRTSSLVNNRGIRVEINQGIVEIGISSKAGNLRQEETRGNRREPGEKARKSKTRRKR
jgi:hypothetical protein